MKSKKTTKKMWTVSDLVSYVRSSLEADNRLQNLWVKGELTNFTLHERSGHMYFTLKDGDAKIKAAMFAGNNRRMRFRPKNGDSVFVFARLSMFERDGQIQLYVQEMQTSGVGDLFTQYTRLKEDLEKKGYFSQKSQTLPKHPKTVGVITSASGAVIRDIMITMRRRYPLTHILLAPVSVQGSYAAREIANAIDQMNQLNEADVLIVGRGGGSLEELWAFNEEIVVESIYRSHIPIISAVGHETDTTLSDFVADLRAPTPTAAAELVVPAQSEIYEYLRTLQTQLIHHQRNFFDQARGQLKLISEKAIFKQPQARLHQYAQRLDYLASGLKRQMLSVMKEKGHQNHQFQLQLRANNPLNQIERMRDKLDRLHSQLSHSIHKHLDHNRKCLTQHTVHLDALSPLKVMQRGYSLTYRYNDEKVITSKNQVQTGDLIRVKVTDGSLKCQIWSTED